VEIAYLERLYESLSSGNDTPILVRRATQTDGAFPTGRCARNGPQINPVETLPEMRRTGQRG